MPGQPSRYMRVQRVIMLGFVVVLALVAIGVVVAALEANAARSSFLDFHASIGTQVGDQAQAARVSSRLLNTIIGLCAFGGVIIIFGIVAQWWISRGIGRMVNSASTKIGRSAAQLLATSAQVSAGAAQTAASTHQTTATVEEVIQTAHLAHEKATEVANNAQTVADTAEAGRTAVEETIAGIEHMQTEMVVVAETINRLSEQAQAVSEIVTTVSDLAEQSNLLSVNASIEAAKAGDQGKGFTVVAQEVKSLAGQSKQAVSQARAILGEIQKAGAVAVQAVDHSRGALEAARRQAVESGETIHALAESVSEAAQSAQQISASSRQQLAGMEQIGQAIESISQAGVQSVTGTRQVEEEVKRLQSLAWGLKRLVDAEAATRVGVSDLVLPAT